MFVLKRFGKALAQMCEECDVEMFMVMPRHQQEILYGYISVFPERSIVPGRLAWLRFLDRSACQFPIFVHDQISTG